VALEARTAWPEMLRAKAKAAWRRPAAALVRGCDLVDDALRLVVSERYAGLSAGQRRNKRHAHAQA
jgi:hypothetical protein